MTSFTKMASVMKERESPRMASLGEMPSVPLRMASFAKMASVLRRRVTFLFKMD
jgi:hypothetical protein